MKSELRVTIAAMPIRRYRSVEEFGADVAEYAGLAAAAGSEVLLLPELTCVGLLWAEPDASGIKVATLKSFYERALTNRFPAYRDVLSKAAKANALWIAGASYWHERAGLGINTGFLVAPDGEVSEQDKLHPTKPEQVIGTIGGDRLRAFDVAGVRVGLLICYDVQFPELTRHLVEEGIEVLLVPSLTTERGYWRVRHAAHARAVENQIYVCVSPLTGDLGLPIDYPLQCTGGAYVTCPVDNRFGITDGLYAGGGLQGAELLYVKLDLEKLRLSRAKGEIRQLKDRRPDFYITLRR